MKIAAMTMAYNEAFFLPIWIAHYGRQCGLENLFIIDDGSSDGSTSDLAPIQVERRARELFDEDKRAALISQRHTELLRRYDFVIYSDVDEYLVAHPDRHASLTAYAAQLTDPWSTAIGLNIIHQRDIEAPIDLTCPILAQREAVQFDIAYCKTLLSNQPITWQPGFHTCNRSAIYDGELFLFHGRAMDYDAAVKRITQLNAVRFSENTIRKGHSVHFRNPPERYLSEIFPIISNVQDSGFYFAPDLKSALHLLKIGRRVPGRITRVPPAFHNSIPAVFASTT